MAQLASPQDGAGANGWFLDDLEEGQTFGRFVNSTPT
jgi:hypothetical protein